MTSVDLGSQLALLKESSGHRVHVIRSWTEIGIDWSVVDEWQVWLYAHGDKFRLATFRRAIDSESFSYSGFFVLIGMVACFACDTLTIPGFVISSATPWYYS